MSKHEMVVNGGFSVVPAPRDEGGLGQTHGVGSSRDECWALHSHAKRRLGRRLSACSIHAMC